MNTHSVLIIRTRSTQRQHKNPHFWGVISTLSR